jgi:hypothetical protein
MRYTTNMELFFYFCIPLIANAISVVISHLAIHSYYLGHTVDEMSPSYSPPSTPIQLETKKMTHALGTWFALLMILTIILGFLLYLLGNAMIALLIALIIAGLFFRSSVLRFFIALVVVFLPIFLYTTYFQPLSLIGDYTVLGQIFNPFYSAWYFYLAHLVVGFLILYLVKKQDASSPTAGIIPEQLPDPTPPE